MTFKNTTRVGHITLIVALIIRLIYVLYFQPISHSIYSDMRNYVMIAEQLIRGEWYATHFFQPIGFPFILYVIKKIFVDWTTVIGIYHCLISTLSLWFVWKTAERSFGEKVGIISLFVGAFHILWLAFTALALSETTFILLLSILAWLSVKVVEDGKLSSACLWAITFLFAFWIKGTHVFFGPLFLVCYFFWVKKDLKSKLLNVIIPISIIVGSGLIAHGFLTYNTIGKFQMSASAGGLNFVEGKCPIKNNADNNGYSWLSPLYDQLNMYQQKKWDHPFTDSGFFMKEGLKCIVNDPLVLIQSLEGIPFLFIGNYLWPTNQYRYAGFIRLYELFFGIFLVVGLTLYIRSYFPHAHERATEFMVWGLPVMALFLCVYIFKSEIRFRIPFDVWFIPIGVKGWMDLMKPIRCSNNETA